VVIISLGRSQPLARAVDTRLLLPLSTFPLKQAGTPA